MPWWSPNDVWPPPSPTGFEDLILMGDFLGAVGVPYTASPELKRNVMGALKAALAGNRSVDHMIRNYGSEWALPELDEDSAIVFEATRLVRVIVVQTLKSLNAVPREKPPGAFAAWAALNRLQMSFQAAVVMVRQGLHFESCGMARLILEQLAWIVRVHELRDGGHFRVKPQSCFGDLKMLVPEAGEVYGRLSEVAHLHPEWTALYVTVEQGEAMLHLRQPGETKGDALMLLYLADLHRSISEYVDREVLDAPAALERTPEGEWRIKPERPLRPLLREYREKLGPSD